MVFITIAWTKGLGRHFAALTPTQQQDSLFYIIGLVEIFSIITCMWGRISFATFLLYIIGPIDAAKKWALWAVIAVQILINLIVAIQIYSQCGPHVTALWNYAVAAHANCQSPMVETIIGYVQSGFNSLCDVTLTILPGMILWNLNMPLGQKIGLGATLTLSIFAFGASLAKAVQIRNLSARNDFTWYMVSLQLWVCIENNVVMVAASIPTLRPLLHRRDGSSHPSKGYIYSENSKRKESAHDPYKCGQDDTTTQSGRAEMDGANSEEYIMRSVCAPEIMKTMDVHVEYETRSEAAKGEEKESDASHRRY
ncbi:hypothetical protein LTR85_010132 [Meristemomyces frigidus]|nr:hypothetical protein LTR85_010132 [Meristemomyces frigidus]